MNRRDVLKKSALLSAYAFSAGTVAAILSSCESDKPKMPAVWKPRFLTADQNEWLIKLVDTILPKSDTPSASEVGVNKFIDDLMSGYCPEQEKRDFAAGMDKVIADKPEDLTAYLTKIAAEAKSNNEEMSKRVENYKSRAFFTQLRSLTLMGYYTSEEVGTEVLAYDPIPGDFIGCYPLEKTGGRAWTL